VKTVLLTLLDAIATNPKPRELIHACVDAYLRTSATAVADTGFTAQKSQARAVQAAS